LVDSIGGISGGGNSTDLGKRKNRWDEDPNNTASFGCTSI
jgi:hypothetical protein